MKDLNKQVSQIRKSVALDVGVAEARFKKAEKALEAAKKEHEDASGAFVKVKAKAEKIEASAEAFCKAVSEETEEGKKTRKPRAAKLTGEKPVKHRGRKPKKEAKKAKPKGKRAEKEQVIPTFAAAIIKVMGSRTMKAPDVTEAVEKEGNAPKSNNLKLYVANVLNSATAKKGPHKGAKIFEKIGRGQFRVAAWVKKGSTDKKAAPEPKETVAKKHPGRPKNKDKGKEDRPKGVRGRPKGSKNRKAETTQEDSNSEQKPSELPEKTVSADDILAELGTNVEGLGISGGTETKPAENPAS
jgi:hypothetical protein